jgi:long-subunit fatty acid transport protein
LNQFTTTSGTPVTIVQAEGRLEALIEDYNLSFGFRGGEKFAGGATLTYSRIVLDSRTENSFINLAAPSRGLDPDFATDVDDQDNDFAFSAGVLIKPIDMLKIGLVYRDGAEFDLEENIEDTRPPDKFPSALLLADFLGNQNFLFDDPLSFNNHFEVPDQYGIGFGIQPNDAFTIAIDVLEVEFSDLESGFVGNVNTLTSPTGETNPPGCAGGPPDGDGGVPCEYATPVARYRLDDSVVYHLGVEYVWSIKDKMPFALRAGVYNDPNVRLDAQFPPGGVSIANDDTFPKGEEELHYTLGFGFVLQDKFQADFSADLSSLGQAFVSSIIFHF